MPQQLPRCARSILGNRLSSRSPWADKAPWCHGSSNYHFTSSAVLPGAAAATTLTAGNDHGFPAATISLLLHQKKQSTMQRQQQQQQRWVSSSPSSPSLDRRERHKRAILTHALHHVHDDGWTDDAIALGTLDAKLPPSYIGMVIGDDALSHPLSSSSSLPLLGNAHLVAFFMEECNNTLKHNLAEAVSEAATNTKTTTTTSPTRDECNHQIISSRIYEALHMRLSMVIPFVKSNRWHEGMAIGALPQNAIRTLQQLDAMAEIVLDYATSSSSSSSSGSEMGGNKATLSKMPMPAATTTLRTAIVAAYAATELHLLSDGSNNAPTTTSSLRGDDERYRDTWKFLRARSAEVARFILLLDDGGTTTLPLFSSSLPHPHPTHAVMTATTAVASSLAGAALSLASPAAAAAVAGFIHVLPNSQNALTSAFTLWEDVVTSATRQPATATTGGGVTTTSAMRGYGTRPSDYTAETTNLPPFDASEEIFSGVGMGSRK